MKQFCMKIDLISQWRENVLFLPSNMAAMTSHENALFKLHSLHFLPMTAPLQRLQRKTKTNCKLFLSSLFLCWDLKEISDYRVRQEKNGQQAAKIARRKTFGDSPRRAGGRLGRVFKCDIISLPRLSLLRVFE